MKEASNIVKGKVSPSSLSAHNSLSSHKENNDPVDQTNVDYFYMMISSCFSAVQFQIPTSYFALLIHHFYGPSTSDDIDKAPIQYNSIDPKVLNAFCSTDDFIVIHQINQNFVLQDVNPRAKSDVEHEWRQAHS
eukprot:15363436-Ditylum_brightwellii.AAC.2